MSAWRDRIHADLLEIRRRRPLIHHIMNYVVMNDAANVTLAIGASPIMAHAVEELEELASAADAVYINIGTLDSLWIASMTILAKAASREGKPLVLDPVGAGATGLRTRTALRILEEAEVSILKGNGGEIGALAGSKGVVKGVDSLSGTRREAVEKLAREYGIVVVATGEVDMASDGSRIYEIRGGSSMARYVTGTGCMMGSVVASFAAVKRSYLEASVEASAVFKRALEMAEKRARLPGSFKVELVNSLYSMGWEDLEDLKIEELRA